MIDSHVFEGYFRLSPWLKINTFMQGVTYNYPYSTTPYIDLLCTMHDVGTELSIFLQNLFVLIGHSSLH